MKKAGSFVFVIILLLTTLIGCGSNEKQESKQKGKLSENIAASDTITDQLGREVTLPSQIDKVVSSYYITTSLIVALNGTDKLVGIEMKPEKRPIYKKAAPQLLELPQVGNSKTISVEECAKLEAQVVIIPVKLKEFIEPLEKLGICVIAVEPETLEQFLECIRLVGKIVGQAQRAEELTAYYQEKAVFVQNLTKDMTEKPKVLLYGTDKNSACTPQMYQNTIIEMAGGNTVTAELTDKKWATVSAEQILEWNPEVMMNLSYSEFSMDEIASDSVLAQTDAVKSGKLYTFPSALEPWDYPTPSSALGILWLTQVLHPDVYDRENYIKDAKEFYKEFYKIEVTEEEIGAE